MPIANSYLRWPSEAPGASGAVVPQKRKMSRTPSPHEEGGRAKYTEHEAATTTALGQEPQDTQYLSAEARMKLMNKIKSRLKQSPPRPPHSTALAQASQSESNTTPRLLPPIEVADSARKSFENTDVHMTPSKIERPRSALHRGDFRQDTTVQDSPWLSTSPTTPWYTPSYRQQQTTQNEGQSSEVSRPSAVQSRARAASNSSLSSSFVYRQPTSPLAVSSHVDEAEEHDLSPLNNHRTHRRRTYSPGLYSAQGAFDVLSPINTPLVSRESTFPRRSLSSFQHSHSFSFASPPIIKSRRPSFSPNASPIQHAPLVGRFEESILRGRMSSNPSRPLDFVAQVGVLGKGPCKASLRCPPHITIPFPAVFYNYGNDRPSPAVDEPSPYVGLVDLESRISPSRQASTGRAHKSRSSSTDTNRGRQDDRIKDSGHRRHKHKCDKIMMSNNIHLPPPKGGYRIPEQGQLQIILKNPNKTAVKLFLVPYDLAGMPPGTKTFIRQRAFSAGPVVDMPLTATGGQPISSISNAEDPRDRPVLRYLIHLHICCPSKGRFFLYKSIRVVFANRVPDGKERLRNEIQLPEPRFTAWKPDNDVEVKDDTVNTTPKPRSLLSDALKAQSSTGIEMTDPFKTSHHRAEEQQEPHRPPARLVSFSRTPLPAILSRATSSETVTLSTADWTSTDASATVDEGAVSPRTASRPPSSPSTDSDDNNVTTSLPNQFKKLSPNKQSREGLLALQFRDLASKSRSGTPDSVRN